MMDLPSSSGNTEQTSILLDPADWDIPTENVSVRFTWRRSKSHTLKRSNFYGYKFFFPPRLMILIQHPSKDHIAENISQLRILLRKYENLFLYLRELFQLLHETMKLIIWHAIYV
jgi:hypothetical protein